jgi:endonuclease-3
MPTQSKKLIERGKRVAKILPILKRLYPDARCSLNHSSPLELLVATILSAQCTDARVNVVTRELFKKYKSVHDYANAKAEDLEKDIQSTGFYRNKAKSIQSMARSLRESHGGKVPATMDELVNLAGVGRKTANVVLGNAFGRSEGVVVDTHVTRLSNRLGLTSHESDAVKIEQDLIAIVPREDWTVFSHLLIHHGRTICAARKPGCENCALYEHCPTGPEILDEREKRETKLEKSAKLRRSR